MSGRFTWFDLMTGDPAAASDWYAQHMAWGTQAWDGPMAYTMFTQGDETFGGAMQLPEEAAKMGAPPHWLGYVGVADVDGAVARAGELGGRVMRPGTDIPGVGRFAILADPEGAVFAVFRSTGGDDGQAKVLAWCELAAEDPDAVWPFYEGLLGWRKTDAMDMGDMGTYQMFGVEGSMGGMMRRVPGMPVSAWTYYFRTDDTHSRTATLVDAGATLIMGPREVPGGDFISVLTDPQGAVLAIYSPKPA